MSRAGTKRHNAKRDANEPAIVAALIAAGASVVRLDEPMDLLIGFRGVTYLLDPKMPKTGRPTDKQLKFMDTWRGGPAGFVRDEVEALKFIGAME